jgi:UMF1 family MFS transporter
MLDKLGLGRPQLRAWALYDWANSAMVTTITAAVFPIYYVRVAGAGLDPAHATQHYATSTTIGLAIIAVLAPLLGTPSRSASSASSWASAWRRSR